MSKIVQYQFDLDGPEAVEKFIREYVLNALERMKDYESSERFSFAPAGTNGRSSVVIIVWGEPEVS